jgi:hypothetical protein
MIVGSSRRSLVAALAAGFSVAACATVTPTPGALTQAQTIYATLEAEHAEQRVEGDMIRARATIDTARTAVAQGENATYVDGEAEIALRTAQIAEAHYGRALAATSTDSLQKLRLTRELAFARARQAALEARRMEAEQRAAAATAQADSLRRAVTARAVTADTTGTAARPGSSDSAGALPSGIATDSTISDSSGSRASPDSARRP